MSTSRRVAVGGVFSALGLMLMLLTSLFPFATYILPMLAGAAMLPVVIEMGAATAFTVYVSVSFLSFLLVPDKETAMMYVALFGYYSIVKQPLDRLRFRPGRFICKGALFNCAAVSCYWVLIRLLGLSYLAQEFAHGLWVGLLLMGNLCFMLYDCLLSRLSRLYRRRLRGRLFRL